MKQNRIKLLQYLIKSKSSYNDDEEIKKLIKELIIKLNVTTNDK